MTPNRKQIGSKVDAGTRAEIESATNDLKQALKGENISEIKRRSEQLSQASHKLAEGMYSQQNAGPDPTPGSGTAKSQPSAAEDDVVDAEYEEVK